VKVPVHEPHRGDAAAASSMWVHDRMPVSHAQGLGYEPLHLVGAPAAIDLGHSEQ
jgi:hypothetical protein